MLNHPIFDIIKFLNILKINNHLFYSLKKDDNLFFYILKEKDDDKYLYY